MKELLLTIGILLLIVTSSNGQTTTVQDDFEGNGTISTWTGDDCSINTSLSNPASSGINTSNTVLEYKDTGGSYANVRFDVSNNFNLSTYHTFTLKIYVPSSGLTGNQSNQVSLKLQDGKIGAPWTTQCEIIKAIVLDQWQTVSFNFQNDSYNNIDPNSLPPIQRTDFNRVLIQLNGENNADHVLAYIDDVLYDGTIPVDPVFDYLVWWDEFNVDGAVNSSKWFHQTQLPAGGNWYNGEIQHYTNRTDNAIVNNGTLKVIAKKENYFDQGVSKQYTSARLNSKFAFTYGRIEVKAKLPSGIGTWPAIWTLGKNINEDGGYWDNQGFGTSAWPACGEIDIMEHWGSNQNFVQSATHTPSSSGGTINHGGQTIPTASTDFHVYTLEWSADKLIFSVDSVVHYTYNPTIKDANTWPFNAEQYILFNFAILPSISPQFTNDTLEIDYIRIYQQNTQSIAEVEQKSTMLAYPNPVDNELTIKFDKIINQSVSIELFSIDGKLISNYNLYISGHQTKITNLENLEAGIYMIKVILNDEVHQLKVIKN